MINTKVYSYDPVIQINLLQPTDRIRWEYEKVYNHAIHLYKGIDNNISVMVQNDNQKPVNITDKTLIFNFLDVNNDNSILFTATAKTVDGIRGRAQLTVPANLLLNVDPQYLNYSVKVLNANDESDIGYVDGSFGVVGQVQIKNGVYPELVSSQELGPIQFTWTGSQWESDALYAHSRLNQNTALQTAAYYMTGFTGTVTVQGTLSNSTLPLPADWFEVREDSYVDQSGIVYHNWTGVYTRVRFVWTASAGSIDKILYRP